MILVTGGTGFIGINLLQRLVVDRESVRLMARSRKRATDVLGPLAKQLEIVEGDILDPCAVESAMLGSTLVFHLAAIGNPIMPSEQIGEMMNANIGGTLNVLIAAVKSNVSRVVFSSSAAVYGDQRVMPISEQAAPDPRSPYAVSKLAAEHLCLAFTRSYGLQTTSLRYFNVYGKKHDASLGGSAVIAHIVSRILQGRPVTLYGDGNQIRDFVNIEDVVSATVSASREKDASGQVLNVGSGEPTSIKEVVNQVASILGRTPSLEMEEARQDEIRSSVADIGSARRILRYSPGWTIARGLADCLQPFWVQSTN